MPGSLAEQPEYVSHTAYSKMHSLIKIEIVENVNGNTDSKVLL